MGMTPSPHWSKPRGTPWQRGLPDPLNVHSWAPSVPMSGLFPGPGHLTCLFLHPSFGGSSAALCPPRCHPGDLPQAANGLFWGGGVLEPMPAHSPSPLCPPQRTAIPQPDRTKDLLAVPTSASLQPLTCSSLNLAFTLCQIYQTSFCSQHTTSLFYFQAFM